jgi:hypothetical protein
MPPTGSTFYLRPQLEEAIQAAKVAIAAYREAVTTCAQLMERTHTMRVSNPLEVTDASAYLREVIARRQAQSAWDAAADVRETLRKDASDKFYAAHAMLLEAYELPADITE